MTEAELSLLLPLIFAHLLAVASPGPDFFATLKVSVSHGQKAGVLTSAGIAFGLSIHCLFALTILATISHFAPFLIYTLKIISSLYLGYIAFLCLKPKTQTNKQDDEKTTTTLNPFLLGLITNVTNPKVFIYISAMFTALSEKVRPFWQIAYSAYMTLQTFIWFSLVSYFFAKTFFRDLYKQFERKVDIAMGIILLYFSIYLLLNQ